MEFLLAHEATFRTGAFAGLLVLIGLAETVAGRRPWHTGRGFRWLNHLSLVVVDTILLRALFPVLALGVAVLAQERGWGLLNQAALPGWLAIVIAFFVLDFVIYLQHRIFHAVPLLWRLHMVHHADRDFDVTTGVRFHPIEILLSMVIKMAVVLAIGAPPVAVVLFEIALSATSLFSHGNIRLPASIDRVLRLVLVTPDMHRVHHSLHRHETNSNFGFNVPWWDRWLGTYRAQPQDGHDAMTIGLSQFQDEQRQTLWWMLWLPFRGAIGDYPRRRPV